MDPAEIVLGDLLVVRPGDQIVVDGALVSGGAWRWTKPCSPASRPAVPKRDGAPLYSGSFCVNGSARFLAQKVGADSLANQLTLGARAYRRVFTPVQREINLVVRVLLLIAGYLELLLVITALVDKLPFVEAVRSSVVVIGLVPNGLFLAIATAYALGAVRIARQGALVQQANAMESLANVDVLCLDKTGTLTANRIRLAALHPLGPSEDELRRLLGDFAASATTRNRTAEAIAAAFPGQARPLFEEVPFSSSYRWSGLVYAGEDGAQRAAYLLGAPETLGASLGSQPVLADGPLAAWTEQGLRVLLFARLLDPPALRGAEGKPALPLGLEPLGLLALSDELRPAARETLESFRESGVKVKIISGDSPETVAALARQAGLGSNLRLVSGLELAEMEPARFSAAAEQGDIFGRITPQQKEQIVHALRDSGHYVAMTGDGVNDVLSLKRANLGIAMQSGSQATRAVADIVLMGDTFSALPAAVREGQRITNGMQDILKLFMARVFYVALLILSTGVIGGFPYAPKNVSILTLLTVGIPTLALAAWARPARIPHVSMVRRMLHFVLPSALTLSLFGLGVFMAYFIPAYASIAGRADETTVALLQQPAQTALTHFTLLCGLLLIVFVEPPTKLWVGGARLNGDPKPAVLAALLYVIYLFIVASWPFQRFFDLAPLGLLDELFLTALALAWAALLRWVWRTRLLERLLSVDLDSGRMKDEG